MAQIARDIAFQEVLAGKEVHFRGPSGPLVIAASNKSALGPNQGSHLVVVRKDNALPEFSPEDQTFLIGQAVKGLLKAEVKVLGLAQNFGKARNEKNPHPHLHLLVSRVSEAELPSQWQTPPAEKLVAPRENTVKVHFCAEGDLRSAVGLVLAQHRDAERKVEAESRDGARVITQIARTNDGQLRISTFVYAGLASSSNLPRLVDARS
jgi:diadenosine tetraphosphate (Ap4A) HIT family hydrolase